MHGGRGGGCKLESFSVIVEVELSERRDTSDSGDLPEDIKAALRAERNRFGDGIFTSRPRKRASRAFSMVVSRVMLQLVGASGK
mmetsp:Transcript_1687/g.2391  ORF Transcript_1687/g.2391 Transcript_1687/m.2391 type:complete len:84 (-) Transcript_1687:901-1152(-)|eukprot:1074745-Amorphochlora_amoeboformis.AAC.1